MVPKCLNYVPKKEIDIADVEIGFQPLLLF